MDKNELARWQFLELIKYIYPEEANNKNKQKANQIGISH